MVTIQHTQHSLLRTEERTRLHQNDLLQLIGSGAFVELGTGEQGRIFILFYDVFGRDVKIGIISADKSAIISIWEKDYFLPEGSLRVTFARIKEARTKYKDFVFSRFSSGQTDVKQDLQATTYETCDFIAELAPGAWLVIKTVFGDEICCVFLGKNPKNTSYKDFFAEYGADFIPICREMQANKESDSVVIMLIDTNNITKGRKHKVFGLNNIEDVIRKYGADFSVTIRIRDKTNTFTGVLGTIRRKRSLSSENIVREFAKKLSTLTKEVGAKCLDTASLSYEIMIEDTQTGDCVACIGFSHTEICWQLAKLVPDEKIVEEELYELSVSLQLNHNQPLRVEISSVTLLNKVHERQLVWELRDVFSTLYNQTKGDNDIISDRFTVRIEKYKDTPTIIHLRRTTLLSWLQEEP
jgi:hypothetical protein